jgi:hypothetical protein
MFKKKKRLQDITCLPLAYLLELKPGTELQLMTESYPSVANLRRIEIARVTVSNLYPEGLTVIPRTKGAPIEILLYRNCVSTSVVSSSNLSAATLEPRVWGLRYLSS